MNAQVTAARSNNAVAIIGACVDALTQVVTIPEEAVEVFATIKPGDQDVYSMYHREACAKALAAVCAYLELDLQVPDLVDVGAVMAAQDRPASLEPEHDTEGDGDAQPA